MIRRNSEGLLVVVSGPSGVGKGTICKKILEEFSAWVSVSMTTRERREGEEEGISYYFVTKEEFEKRIEKGMLLEYAMYNGNYYGTPKDKILEHVEAGVDSILEIEVQGGEQVKKMFPNSVLIYIAPPSKEVLKERLIGRNTESLEVIEKRIEIIEKEIKYLNIYDYIVVNDDLEVACEEVINIIRSEKLKVSRVDEFKI